MDLRELYESIIASKHLRRTKRFKIGRKSYAITYEVHHKYLTIKKIKRIKKKNNLRRRHIHIRGRKSSVILLYRHKNFNRSASPKRSSRVVSTIYPNLVDRKNNNTAKSKGPISVKYANAETQTELMADSYAFSEPAETLSFSIDIKSESYVKKLKRKSTQTLIKYCKNQNTETDKVLSYSKAEQTYVKSYARSSQTELPTQKRGTAIGVNVKPVTQHTSNQTEYHFSHQSTETTMIQCHASVQTDMQHLHNEYVNYCETIIILLNEIGEALLLQTAQFENVILSIEQLFDWTFCFHKVIRLRKLGNMRKGKNPPKLYCSR